MLMLLLAIFGAEESIYNFDWLDKDKEVYVLQNRVYRKSAGIMVTFGAGMAVSGSFTDAINYQARAGYFFRENLGFELLYSLGQGEENETAREVWNLSQGQGQQNPGAIPYRRIIQNYIGGVISWSPFYGKINTFDQIMYFDFILGVGGAMIEEINNRGQTAPNQLVTNEERNPALLIQSSLLLFLTQNLNFRVDLVTNIYWSNDLETSTQKMMVPNYDLTFSLGYVL